MESDYRRSRYYEQLGIEGRRATEELKRALGRRGTSALKARLLTCGTATEWKNVVRCGAVACATCRAHYTSRQVRAVQDAFEGTPNTNLVFVTIVLGLCSWADDIGDLFARGRRKLRNIIEQNRRKTQGWRELQIVGWLEVDAFDPHRFEDLPPSKKAQLDSIGLPFAGAGPTWIVTLHALADLGGTDRYRLAEELRRGWSAPTQVDVKPFNSDNTESHNINSLVRYCLKHRTNTATVVCYAEPWDISWKTEYYEYLNRWSRGFQSTRVWIKPSQHSNQDAGSTYHTGPDRNANTTRPINHHYCMSDDIEDDDDEGLPFVF